jgi:hypothetical protein
MASELERLWLREQIEQTRKQLENIEEKLAIVAKQISEEVKNPQADQAVNMLARLQVVESTLLKEKENLQNLLLSFATTLTQGRELVAPARMLTLFVMALLPCPVVNSA